MYLSNSTPTLLPQTLAWGSFKANDNQMPTLIFSNTLRLNFTGLTQNTAYNWTIKVQKGLPNASALDSNNFTTGAGETTKSLNIYLMAGLYNVGNTYFFGLAQAVAGGEEGIQFDFKIDNRITLDTGGSTITGQLLNQAFSYSGQSFNVLTNRFLDELSLEKTNITVFTNAKIPTTLAVKTYLDTELENRTPKKMFYPSKMMEFGSGFGLLQTAGANNIYYQLVEIDRPATVFGLRLMHTGGVINGNIQGGLYKIANANKNDKNLTLTGSTRIATAPSIAQANFNQSLPFSASVDVQAGLYFMAIQYSSATAQFIRYSNFTIYSVCYLASAGSYDLPDTVPSGATLGNNNQPVVLLVCDSSYN